MALRPKADMAPHDVAADSGLGKLVPGAEGVRQRLAVPASTQSGKPEIPGAVRKSVGTAETGMTQNEALLLKSFVKEGFVGLSSRMDRSERRREKETSTLMDFLKQSFSNLSDRMDRSGKTQEKRTEDLEERMDRAAKAKGKRAKYLLRRLDRIAEREMKFFRLIAISIGATAIVLGAPLYLPLFNSG